MVQIRLPQVEMDETAFVAVRRLFAEDGPFRHDRNPILLIGPDGKTDTANPAGTALSALLFDRLNAEFHSVFSDARAGNPVRVAAMEITGADGKPQAFDLTLLPCPAQHGMGVLILGRDVSLERALRSALIDSRQRFKELIDTAADFTWEVDAEGKFSFISGSFILGHIPSDLIGRLPQDFALADGAARAFDGSGPSGGSEIWLKDATNRALCLLVQAQPLVAEGPFRGARGLARDITAQKMRETELAEARHRERLVIHLLRSLRRAIDPAEALAIALDTAIQAVGAEAGCVARLTKDGLVEALTGDLSNADLVLAQTANQGIEDVVLNQIGDRLGLALLCRHESQRVGVLILWRDIARGNWAAEDLFLLSELAEQSAVLIEQLKDHETLKSLSTTDPMTGLLNRRGFESALTREVAQARQEKQNGALFYIDLDNFKQVNDQFGHAQGDAVLIATANILRNELRASDTLGRLGGDEFVAWLAGIDRNEAIAKAEALQNAACSLSKFAPGTSKPVGFSIGIAMLRLDPADSLHAFMMRADEAMYRIKHGNKGSYVLVE